MEAGQDYHSQLPEVRTPGQVILASKVNDRAKFQDVLFIVDDGEVPIKELMLAALREADQLGAETVAIPVLRFDSSMGYGDLAQNIMKQTMEALAQFGNELEVNFHITLMIDDEILEAIFEGPVVELNRHIVMG